MMSPTIHDQQEHEEAILAAAMFSSQSLHVSQRIVSGRDFTDGAKGQLFELMVALEQSGRPTNNLTLLRDSVREFGQRPDLVSWARWMSDHPTADLLVEHHAREIRQAADLRTLMSAATDAVRMAGEAGADPNEISSWLSARLDSLAVDRSRGAITAPEAVDLAIARHKVASLAGYGTGLRGLDDALGPMSPEQLIILAARPGNGKSALALQIACDIARSGNHVLFVSIEMTEAEQAERLLARALDEPVRQGAHSVEYSEMLEGIKGEAAPETLLLWKARNPRLKQIRAEAKLHHAKHPLALVVVDYLQLVRADERMRERHLEVGEISAGLKALAGELQCPVLALSQLNREAEGKRPSMANLRESGSIEQDADGIVFIYRAEEIRGDTANVEMIVAKRRSGPGEVATTLVWHGPTTSFRDREARDLPNYDAGFDDWNRSGL